MANMPIQGRVPCSKSQNRNGANPSIYGLLGQLAFLCYIMASLTWTPIYQKKSATTKTRDLLTPKILSRLQLHLF